MKKLLQAFILSVIVAGFIINVAQGQTITAPAFTYASPQTYIAGTDIGLLKPVNTGGAIPGGLYGQTFTFATGFSPFFGIVTDTARNIYIADVNNNIIKKITPGGVVTRFAGNGTAGFVNGTGSAASFNSPIGLTIDAAGYLYVTEAANNAIRKISPYGVVTTLAGNGTAGNTNGTGAAAKFNNPSGITIDNSGNLYVSDNGNSLIRKITSAGVVSTLAGSGSPGSADGASSVASFSNPVGITIDATGNVYVADGGNNAIRKITSAGVVSTLAGNPISPGSVNGLGSAASFNGPQGITIDALGNLYVADIYGALIRKITPAGLVSTLAGGGTAMIDGIGSTAGFQYPNGITIDKNGTIYVAENNDIRKVSSVGYALSATLPAGLSFDGTNGSISGVPLLATAASNYLVTAYNVAGIGTASVNITVTGALKVTAPATKAPIITYAGTQSYTAGTAVTPLAPANTGGAVPAIPYGQTSTLATGLGDSYGLVTDVAGNVYYADDSYNVIRKVTPSGITSIFAGSGSAGAVNGVGTAASFNNPQRMAIDAGGNIYLADMNNNRIRKITPAGVVTTFAGSGVAGRSDGPAATASFNGPAGVALDTYGNLYVADYNSHLIRKISPAGLVSTLAGNGSAGYADGTGSAAIFYNPAGMAVDGLSNLYVADVNNNLIRKITPSGVVTTFAGTAGTTGAANGSGTAASFYNPQSLVLDAAGNLFVADMYNHLVRKITPAGLVTTLAGGGYGSSDGTGTAAGLSYAQGIAIDASGNVYVTEANSIRKISTTGYALNQTLPAGLSFDNTTGIISGIPLAAKTAANYSVSAYNLGGSSTATINITVTGTLKAGTNLVNAPVITYAGPQSYTAGTAITTLIPGNTGGAVPGVLFGQTTTLATGLGNAYGIVADAAGNVYYADASYSVIRKVTPAGVSSIFAGSGTAGFVNGTGTAASFNNPQRMAIDAAGNIYLADAGNNAIRKITPAGIVTTFAGTGLAGRNDGPGAVASFSNPAGVAVDAFGNIYVSDFDSNLIRKISSGGVVTTLAGSGSGGYADGTGTAASFHGAAGLAVDGLSNVYVADLYNEVIRKITPAGVVTTVAGTANTTGAVNGTGIAASFYNPQSIAIDVVGNLYVADEYNYQVRKITPGGVVTTLAGSSSGSTYDGIGLSARFSDPEGITIDASGSLYVADGGAIRKVSAVGYMVSPTLPAGLSFTAATGAITGIPLLAKTATNYSITAYNTGGSNTATLSIAVTGTLTAPAAIAAPVIAYTGPQTYTSGTAIAALSPSNTGGAIPATLYGQTTTFAGTGAQGTNDGPGAAAAFYEPTSTAADAYGNIYVADYYNNVIRKITSAGVVSTFAGNGIAGYTDATGTAASFYYPSGVAVDVSGTVYVADSYNHVIRKITPAGVVTTFAGSANSPGYTDATGVNAAFSSPVNVAVDASKNVYVSDQGNAAIRKITSSGVVTTLAGGSAGYADGTGAAASFNNLSGITVDGSTLYVADQGNNVIRKITSAGVVTTFAGTAGITGYNDGTGAAASFNSPTGIAVDKAGNLYVTDISNNLIRKITKTGVVSTLAGNGSGSFINGNGTTAGFNNPWGVTVDYTGNLYVADRYNQAIRKITATGYTTDNALPAGLTLDGTTGIISGKPTNPLAASVYSITAYNGGGSSTATVSITVTGTATTVLPMAAPAISYASPKSYGVGLTISALTPANTGGAVPAAVYAQTSTLANIGYYSKGIAFDKAGNAYITYYNKILKVTPAGVISTFAGNENAGAVNGKGSAASFSSPQGICFDVAGNLYVADMGNQQIRKVSPTGVVTNFAGVNGVSGAKNGAGNIATFYNPEGITSDIAGNIYVADAANNMIRKITSAGVVSTLAGATDAGYIDGTGVAAKFNTPYGLAIDATGNVYVSEQGNSLIRKITPAALVTTLAGSAGNTGSTDGTGTAASFNNPAGITIDAAGNIYVADFYNSLIRKVSSAGVVTTLAGNAATGSINGIGTKASFYYPQALAIDGSGNLFETDYNNTIRKISLIGYTLSGTLPAGLAFDGTTGTISGTPVLSSPATNYTVTAYNAGGSSSTTVNIATTGTVMPPVNPVKVPIISYASPQSYAAGVSIATLSPSNTGGPVPAMIYAQTNAFVTGVNYSHGLVTDVLGNVYYTNNNQVFKSTPAGVTSVFAGNGNAGFINDAGTAASFNNPQGLAIDVAGNVYVADANNNMIRKITPAGVVSTFAGNSGPGNADGPGISASFNAPQGITADVYGNIYVADQNNNLIRKISSTGIVSTLAGGLAGYADGTGTSASFNNPYGIVADASGNLYVSEQGNQLIRKITPAGLVSTLAGSVNNAGAINGTGAAASFYNPSGLAIDAAGNIYVADFYNSMIRKVSPAGVVTTLAGNGTNGSTNGVGIAASFYYPQALAVDGLGNLYEADYNNTIRKISLNGYTLTGTLPAGLTFDSTTGAISGTPVLAAAASSYTVTANNAGGSSTTAVSIAVTGAVTPPVNPVKAPIISYATPQNYAAGVGISTLSPTNTGGAVPSAIFAQTVTFSNVPNYSRGLVTDAAGNIYYTNNNQVNKTSPAGVTTVFAGNGNAGFINDAGTTASFNNPLGLAIDATGNIYVADAGNNMIRKITPAGVVTTLAGNANFAAGRADGPGTLASFNAPQSLTVDAYGNVYVTDFNNNLIRKISPSGIVSTLAGNSAGYADGIGTSASFNGPYGIAVDVSGNLFVSDQNNHVIRKISPAGSVTTLAGKAGSTGATNGTGTAASFYNPSGLATDAAGNIYVADFYNSLIRKVSPGGVVTTLAGNTTIGVINGVGTAASFYYPLALTVDGLGNLYETDYNNVIRKISLNGYTLAGTLPAGLTFDATTGSIVGTPLTAVAAKNYTITAYNSGGSSAATVSIAVTGTAVAPVAPTVPVISYTTPQIYAVGIPITPLAPVNTGGAVPPSIYSTTGPFVGSGVNGSNDGAGAAASFNNINAITTDIYGNIYTVDAAGYNVRRITPGGFVTTIAGSGTNGFVNGTGTAASFGNLTGIAVDKNSNVFVTDQSNQVIRKISPLGVVTTFAGNGSYGSVDGSATVAGFANPLAITVDKSGVLYVVDNGNTIIRKINTAGVTSTLAGNGSGGFTNGTGTAASFNGIKSLAVDASGNIYVTDAGNNAIRKVTSAGVVTTLAGNGSTGFADGTGAAASFSSPAGIALDAGGNIYVADQGNSLIRKITPAGVVTTVAGNGNATITDGVGQSASFGDLPYLTVDNSGNIYVDDSGNTIRKVSINGYTNSAPLSSGLNFAGTTGIISGTPTVASPATTYAIKGNNSAGSGAANLSITVIYPPVVTTTPAVTAFASMGDVTPVPVVIDGAVTVTDLSKTALASATVAVTGNFVMGQDVLAFTPNAATMGNIAATYNATTGVMSLTSASATATLAQWQAALQAITYNNSNNVAPNVASRTISFAANDGMFSSATVTKTIGLKYTPSSNAKLSSLTLSAGNLSPVFASLTNAYTAVVGNSVSSITIKPVTISANATLTVNGTVLKSGVTSAAIPLNVGANTITTAVTAQDLTTILTYTVTVSRNAAQTITFNPLTAVNYGKADFAPGAVSTNSTIPVTYTSSNTAVATITPAGNIHVLSPGTATITASQAAGVNFDAAPSVTQLLTVNPAALTITAVNQIKNYGAANPTLTVNYAGFVNGDTQASLTTFPTVSTTATTTSAAGSYLITTTGAASANYTITYKSGTLTINPVSLTVTANNQTKAYGAANPAFTLTYAGFVNGDTQAAFTTLPTASTTAIASSPAGTYAISASGGISTNYTVNYISGTLIIGKAGLVITADNQSKVYGTANPILTASYAGFVNNDNAATLLTPVTLSTTATTTSAVGSYPVTLSGATSNNYNITYTQGTLTITPVVIAFNPIAPKVYGTTDFAPGATSTTTITYTSSNTAVATIVSGNVHITGAGTATITASNGTSSLSQSLSVTPAVLTITANNQTKVAGTANPALTLTYSGFANGDTQASLTTQPAVTTSATSASVVGSYPITVSGAAGANYTFSYVAGTLAVTAAPLTFAALPAKTYGIADFSPGATSGAAISYTSSNTAVATIVAGNIHVAGKGTSIITATSGGASLTQTLIVNPAALTITAANQTKITGATNPALTLTYSGFVNGDTQTVLTTQATVTTTATTASAVGTYPITASGAAAANYNISYVAGTLTVSSAPLTFAAIPTKTYGTADFNPGATSGSAITYASSNTAVATVVSGNIHIIGTGTSTITATSGATSLTQSLTVGKAALAITAANQTKIYGAANPVLTATYAGFVNGETQAVLTTQPTLSTTAVAASAVGSYPITVTGAVAANYTISYTAGTLTVGKAGLTITAANQTKITGAANPALTLTYSGFVNGDTQTVLTTQATVATTATTASAVGTYPITASGAAAANYNISYVAGTLTVSSAPLTFAAIPAKTYGTADFNPGATSGSAITYASSNTAVATIISGNIHIIGAGTSTITATSGASSLTQSLTVGKAALAITAASQTKIYGAANPVLTATYAGFVNGETQAVLTTQPTLSTTAVAASAVGSYPITATGVVAANYTISYTAGTLTVGKAGLTITAANQTKVAGAANPALTLTYSGFVNGDTQTVLTTQATVTTTATTASAVGTYPITASGAAAANYNISYVAGTLTVSSAPLTFAAIPAKTYGTADFNPGATSGSAITYASSNTAVATIVSGSIHIVGAGTSTITATSGANSSTQTLTISPAVLTIAAANQTKIYGAANPALTATFTGFVNGETQSVLTTQPTLLTTAVAASVVGSYPITASGAVAKNYTLSYTAGSLTIGKAALAITANSLTKVTGAANPTLTVSYTGFVNGDTQTVLTTQATVTTTATAASAVGNYPINASGAVATNYNISYVAGTLTVTNAVLGVPIISYAGPQNYASGTAITALTPVSTGGVVPNAIYGQTITFAGSGTAGSVNSTGIGASFNNPSGVTFDKVGNAYVAETGGNLIRKITPAGVVKAFAGSGIAGSVDGTGTAASFNQPSGIVADAAGNIYVSDAGSRLIRKITSAGVVTTFAGSGASGSADGLGTVATFGLPEQMAIDGAGNLYVADAFSGIRKITPAGMVSTLPNGFQSPFGVAVDNSGYVYVSDFSNRIFKLGPNGPIVLAGNGAIGSADGTGASATFNNPNFITVDALGNVYVADSSNGLVRKITPAGVVTTLAGSGIPGAANGTGTAASFYFPFGIAVDVSGNVYTTDANRVRKIMATGYGISPALPPGLAIDGNGAITGTPTSGSNATNYTVNACNTAGTGTAILNIAIGGANTYQPPVISYAGPQIYTVGAAITALKPVNTGGVVPAVIFGQTSTLGSTIFNEPRGVVADAAGNVYVAEENSQLIRKITPAGVVSTFAGSGATGSVNGTGTTASFNDPKGMAIDASGNIYVTETGSNLIRKITPAGVVSTLAGSGAMGAANGTGTAASFAGPKGAAADAIGNVYVADEANNLIRKITPAGVVTTFAGSGAIGAVNGYGTAASFSGGLIGIAIDAYGNLFVTDGNLVRKITSSGLVSTFAGGGNTFAADGFGTSASFGSLEGITIDKAGNLYVADGDQIRMITSAAVVTTIAGDGNGDGKPTNGIGKAASFSDIYGVTADKLGNLYVGDTGNGLVRKIAVLGYSINPALPAGLSFDGTTGTISGAPTAGIAATNYVITAYNNIGSDSANIAIAVTQPLKFVAMQPATYGMADFDSGAVSSNPITYSSSNAAVATIVAGKIHVIKLGTSVITAVSGGVTLTQTLTVVGAPVVVTPLYQTKIAGSANPTFTLNYSGFVNGDTQAVLTTQPTITTTATAGSIAGSYPITASGAVAANYTFVYVPGVLTVLGTSGNINPPLISYSGAQSYTVGTTIAALNPVLSGGAAPARAYAQVSTLAGSSFVIGKVNGTGNAASFNYPFGLTTDAAGNVYVADNGNNLIRKITPAGVTTTLAGSGAAGAANGTGTASSFNRPVGLTADAAGNIYVADVQNNLIRKVSADGVVTTFAGNGTSGSTDGAAAAASFNGPRGLAIDAAGNVYVADAGNNKIRKITPAGTVITIAGNGNNSLVNGTGTAASFNYPTGVALDVAGNIYVADGGNNVIRKITQAAVVTTLSGTGATGHVDGASTAATFSGMQGIAVDALGLIYVSDFNNQLIRRVTPAGAVSTLAGTGAQGAVNAIGIGASFVSPSGLTLDGQGNLYVAEADNEMIRKINLTGYFITPALPTGLTFDATSGAINGTPTAVSAAVNYAVTATNTAGIGRATVSIAVNQSAANASFSYAGPKVYTEGTAITPLLPTLANGVTVTPQSSYTQGTFATGFQRPGGIAIDAAGNLYVADTYDYVIRKITPAGIVTVLAGSGQEGSANGTGTAASFDYPQGVAVDKQGNVYVGDQFSNMVRKITPAGVVTTLAGSGARGYRDGTASAAIFDGIKGVAVDAQGNVYVADAFNGRIRKITSAGVVTTFAGSGAVNGTGPAFNFNYPTDVAVDAQGYVYVADTYANRICKITPAGATTILAGSGDTSSVDGVGTAASFSSPSGIALDAQGNVFVSDFGGSIVRKITPTGVVTTLAAVTYPHSIAIDSQGNIFVADGNATIRKLTYNNFSYAINKTLPGGLSFNPTTGVFSGTPTGVSPANNYTVTAYTNSGPLSTAINIAVVNNVTNTPVITTIAGNASYISSGDGGLATSAGTPGVYGLARDKKGNLYLATADDYVRKVDVTTKIITTLAGNGKPGFAGDGGAAKNAQFNLNTPAIAVDTTGNIYVADDGNNRIRRIDATTGIITTIAGNGTAGFGGDGGLATSANLSNPGGMAFDTSNNLYFADEYNSRVRKINAATKIITTVAGNGNNGYGGDGGLATAAPIDFVERITLDKNGNLYISEEGVGVVRKVDAKTNIITTVAGTPAVGDNSYSLQAAGDGGLATSAVMAGIMGITFDAAGNLYIADQPNGLIRKVDAVTQKISTYAGIGADGYSGDGGPANLAGLSYTSDIFFDSAGIMYVDDSGNSVIRKIGVAAAAQTVAFANVAAKVYGAADFTPAVSASSGLPLTYTSSNTNVATFVNGVVHIVGKGTATLTATQAGNASYLTASASQTLTVTPATLTITANNQSKSAGSINPALTVTYAGFVYGQTQSILTAQPAVSTTATAASAVGTYPIAVSGAVAANYNISYTAGVLTVTVANVGVNKSLAASYVAPGLPAEPKVKQAMSPNGDGINDVLVIDNIESYPDNKVSLMDNSGVMVFVTSGYDNANRVFTGRSNKTGAMLKAGTYYYVLEYHDNGEAKRKTGFFIIKY